MIKAVNPYVVLVISTAHVYSANILSGPCPKMKKIPHLCLDLIGKEAYLPRTAGGTVEIDWQLLSAVTPGVLISWEVRLSEHGLLDRQLSTKSRRPGSILPSKF